MQQIVIGTAGHIDHGKTSLVEALTGTNTDTLLQEKSRGITIDLGFAYLNEQITIVDVPGHQRFIRNMVAGSSTIHIGLLVIAADDGVMPQTLEHLHILNSLSILIGITVITKIDGVDNEWIDLVISDIKKIQKDTIFQSSRIFKVDSLSHKGIDELKNSIISISQSLNIFDKSKVFKMYVDRVFNKKGYGSIVTGTIKSGNISKGDSIEILPEKITATVRGVQTHGGEVTNVKFGDRAALNLSKIDINVLKRGSVLSTIGKITVTNYLIVNLTMSKHTLWTMQNNQRVRIHLGTAEILARINLQIKKIEPGKTSNAILRLEKKCGVTLDELFVVRSYSPMETIASGIVLDANERIKKDALGEIPVDKVARLKYMISRRSKKPLTVKQWSEIFFLSEVEILKKIKLIKAKITKSDLVYFCDNLNSVKQSVVKYVKEKTNHDLFHSYVEMNNLKLNLNLSSDWAKYIVNGLVNEELLTFENGRIKIKNQDLIIDKKTANDIDSLKNIISNSPLKIISMNELVKKSKLNPKYVKDLVFILNDRKKVVIINMDIVSSADAFDSIISKLQTYFSGQELLSVSSFKELSMLSRKNAIPMLEYLDINGYTIRNGADRKKGPYFFEQ